MRSARLIAKEPPLNAWDYFVIFALALIVGYSVFRFCEVMF